MRRSSAADVAAAADAPRLSGTRHDQDQGSRRRLAGSVRDRRERSRRRPGRILAAALPQSQLRAAAAAIQGAPVRLVLRAATSATACNKFRLLRAGRALRSPARNYNDAFAGTLGGGFKYSWFRADVTVDRSIRSSFSGDDRGSHRPAAVHRQDHAAVGARQRLRRSRHLGGFTPYVGAGAASRRSEASMLYNPACRRRWRHRSRRMQILPGPLWPASQ